MWKTHKRTGIEFTASGKVRGHTEMRVKKGYLVAVRLVRSPDLPKSRRTYTVYVHRAVAELFIGPARGKHVNHKDGVKQNNRRLNLEYVTRAGNAEHAHRTGLINAKGEGNGRAVLTEAKVKAIRRLDPGKTTRTRDYSRREKAREVAKKYGVTDTSIIHVWNRTTWSHVK
jgi:hypothetical protein